MRKWERCDWRGEVVVGVLEGISGLLEDMAGMACRQLWCTVCSGKIKVITKDSSACGCEANG